MACVRTRWATTGTQSCPRSSRQHADTSHILTRVLVFLVPLGMLDVFGDQVQQANPEELALHPDARVYVVPMRVASCRERASQLEAVALLGHVKARRLDGLVRF